ncbi:MAG: gliding motility-associated C-terminal domain-containing protein [Paludibacteraceae bacterium]|nr:gliding motility-associated C-terminal domain-containing protein [Paludibacteraceae bacterium]
MKTLFFKGFVKFALIGAMLCGAFVTYADENFCISVYKDGSSSQMFYFTLLSGDEYLCDNIVIDNYTGNPNDYKYWVGKDGYWYDGMSENFNLGSSNSSYGSVSGTDYISSCSTGAFSVKIYSGSGDKNWYPHNWTCETAPEPGSCDVQAKGASIPAGTIIFYDNSDHLFDTEIWLSVPTESGNGNASNVNQGSYHRNKDSWYQMKKVDGDIWMATITTASSYGRMSFWNKDGHDADDVWENTVVFQAPYTSGKNLYKPDASKKCANSSRKSDVYFKGSWGLYSNVVLVSDIYAYKYTEKPQGIKLTAIPVGLTDTKYVFEYKDFDKDTWEPLVSQADGSYTLTGEKIPSKTTYYRVSYGGKTSPEVKIQVIISCADGGSSAHLFGNDFGTLPSLKGTDSRRGGEDMSSDYSYQPYPKKINDGYYAVVATPYYCGCGEGGDMSQSVEDCEGNNMWFRQYLAPTSDKKEFRDHTVGDAGTAGNYGGMLFINFKDGKSNVAYQHELTPEDKSLFKKGSTLSFSAYFANATKNEGGSLPIDMELVIQKKKAGEPKTAWVDATKVSTKVGFNDNWQYQEASLDIEENGSAADYQLIIRNHGGTGVGNDVLIDDISVDLCVPTFPAEYYDNTKTPQTYTSTTFNKLTDSEVVRIADIDFGLGSNPCVYLLKVDETKKTGEAGRYKYIKSMSLDGSYYTASVNAREILTSVPQSGNLQVFVTKESLCGQTTIDKLEAGTIAPMQSADYVFSQNLLDYNSTCSDVLITAFDGNSTVCEESGKKEKDLPKINVTFGCVSEFVKYTLKEDETVLIDQKDVTTQEISEGKLVIDLNEVTGVVRTSGSHKFVILKTEYFTDGGSEICNSVATALTLIVKAAPSYDTTKWPAEINYCQQKAITVNASNAISYQWYVDKTKGEGEENWEKLTGATSAIYNLPADAENGWRYKVELGNDYCTIVTTAPVTLVKIAGVAPTVKPYEECATKEPTKKYLKDLVTSGYTKLTWYKADKTTVIPEAEAYFDASEVTSEAKVYYVTDTPDGGCESELSESVSVMIKKSAVAPTVKNYDECKDSSKPNLDLSTLIVNPSAGTQYKFYDETGAEIDKTVSISTSGVKTYRVGADAADGCGFEPVKITVTVKNTIESISLTPEEENIVLGGSVTKTLSYEPSAAAKTIDWTINGATFDGVFPRKPYTDEVYKVTITDECGNKFNASAKIIVEWPTIFTPYNADGANDDFVKGLDSPISIQVYDRTGNMVYEGSDGWTGEGKNGTLVMPGVYYYVATLPDGSKRKATVEVYK